MTIFLLSWALFRRVKTLLMSGNSTRFPSYYCVFKGQATGARTFTKGQTLRLNFWNLDALLHNNGAWHFNLSQPGPLPAAASYNEKITYGTEDIRYHQHIIIHPKYLQISGGYPYRSNGNLKCIS